MDNRITLMFEEVELTYLRSSLYIMEKLYRLRSICTDGCVAMRESLHSYLSLGIFIVVFSWFSFTLYQLAIGIMRQIVYFTDVPGSIGLGFRTAASFIALITVLFHLSKRKLSNIETLTSLRWVILLEGVYWLTFFPSAIWGFQFEGFGYSKVLLIVSTGLPCLIESTLTPAFLFFLFINLNPNNPIERKIKCGAIAGTVYLSVFWINYTLQWLTDIIQSGVSFIICYPVNAFTFTLTVGGLFVLMLYSLIFAKKSLKKEAFERFKLKRVGVIITAFGLYFDVIFLLWLLFGSPSGWSFWYTFLVYHNADLWMLSLPLAGIPLALSKTN